MSEVVTNASHGVASRFYIFSTQGRWKQGGLGGAWLPNFSGIEKWAEQKEKYITMAPLRICGPSTISGTDFHCVSSLSQKCNQFLTLFAIFSRFFRRHLFKWSKYHDCTFEYCWGIHYFIVLLNFQMTKSSKHLSIDKQRFHDSLVLIEIFFFHPMPIADEYLIVVILFINSLFFEMMLIDTIKDCLDKNVWSEAD